jgi:diacylglycerol kinase family enzyme
VRIALAANRASGGGMDPEPLAAAMRAHGAEVAIFDIRELERIPECAPERVAVASGDGTIGRVAELAGRPDRGCRAR